MKKDYSAKIEKLTKIGEQTIAFFGVIGLVSVAFMLLGSIIATIVAGISGHNYLVRIVISISLFGIAVSSLFADLHCIAYIWITVLQQIEGIVKLRYCVSTIVGYCFALAILLCVGFFTVKLGITYLIDPKILNSIT